MLKAVIFDFDGVISDTERTHLQAFNKILAKYNIEISEADYYKKYLGLNDYEGFIFEELAKSQNSIIYGTAEFINMLKQNGIQMAICSGAVRSDIDAILSGTGLPDFFEAIVTADEVKESKPDPAGFNMALKKLNEKRDNEIPPAECVVVEDSPWGLEAARKAGMHTLAVTNSYAAEELDMAEKVVADLSKVTIAELQKLCK
jgi:beta-phosphoglucomutase